LRYFNLWLFFAILSIFVLFDISSYIKSDLAEFLTKEQKATVDIYKKSRTNESLIVAIKGYEPDKLDSIKKLKQKLNNINHLSISSYENEAKIDYENIYKPYINSIKYKNSKDIDIDKKLQDIKQKIKNSDIYLPLDRFDPLEIFEKPKPYKTNINIINGNTGLGEFGYLAVFDISTNLSFDQQCVLYDKIHDTIKNRNIKHFAPFYYFVENERYIKEDVKFIVLLSTFLLLFLYMMMLRNFILLANVLVTVVSSVIIGAIASHMVFGNISIISFALAVSWTAVAVDYMFHHYFFGYYETKKGFNSFVFFGFLTTFIALAVLSFSSFVMIKQITLFCMTSLGFAYVSFAFIYPHLKIKQIKHIAIGDMKHRYKLPSIYMVISSLVLLVGAYSFISVDKTLQNLNYHNTKLIKTQKFFENKLNRNNFVPAIIKADTTDVAISTINSLKKQDIKFLSPLSYLLDKQTIQHRQEVLDSFGFDDLKQRLDTLSKKHGFTDGYFKNSYVYKRAKYDENIFKDSLYTQNGIWYLPILIQQNTKKIKNIISLDSQVVFRQTIDKAIDGFAIYAVGLVLGILLFLVAVTRRRFVEVISYVLLPMAVIAIYGALYSLNILQLFMGLVVLSVAVDFAIYKAKEQNETNIAIIYSLLSTFAGFGVLMFSDIASLVSIGIVAVLGVLAVLFLIFFQK